MNFIPLDEYSNIIKAMPVLCVDIVAKNSRDAYLLIKRVNEPKKNKWWVIGGRVLKGETLKDAARRKVKEETGLRVNGLQPIGYFELLNDVSPFGLPFKYHTISVVFKAAINDGQVIELDNQSLEFKFVKKLPADFKIRPFGSLFRGVKGDDIL